MAVEGKAFYSEMLLTKMDIYMRLLRMVIAYNCEYGRVDAEIYDSTNSLGNGKPIKLFWILKKKTKSFHFRRFPNFMFHGLPVFLLPWGILESW